MADDIIAGRNPVLEVLRSDRDINKVWLQEGTEKGVGSQILALAKKTWRASTDDS